MASRLMWYGKKWREKQRDEMAQRLLKAAMFWVRETKKKLGKVRNPSAAPGAYPAKKTGHLRRNIAHGRVDKRTLSVEVGTNVPYGKHLELGTRRMAPRPWMSLANKETRRGILRILREPIK